MKAEEIIVERLILAVKGGFDIQSVSKEALAIYQDPDIKISKKLDMILLSLIAMEEGAEFEYTENDFLALLAELRKKAEGRGE